MVKPAAVNKKRDEFHTRDVNAGSDTPVGYPKGIEQKILSGGPDKTNKRGSYFDPVCATPARCRARAFLSSIFMPRAICMRCACGEPAPCRLSVR